MKKIISFALAACLLLALAACDTEPKTETRYVMATQIYEMPDNGIYRETVFHYTEDGKVESMVTTENDEEVSRVEFVMNEDGMVWKQIATEGGTTSTTEYAYTLDDAGNPIRTEQTVDGAPYSVNEYTYDGDGNLLTGKTTSERIGLISTITYTPSGSILKQESDYGEGRVYTTDFTYDNDGKLLSTVTNDAGGRRETRYEYDSQGREIKSTEYLEDGTVNQYSESSYDGLTETNRSFLGDGTMMGCTVITRDEHGNTLIQEHYDQDELMFRQSFTWLAFEVIVD